MSHFPSAAHLASWAGICPGNHESAGKRKSGKTRKGSRWLRQVLIEAANSLAWFQSNINLGQSRPCLRAISDCADSVVCLCAVETEPTASGFRQRQFSQLYHVRTFVEYFPIPSYVPTDPSGDQIGASSRLVTPPSPKATDAAKVREQIRQLKLSWRAGDEELDERIYFAEFKRLEAQLHDAPSSPPTKPLDVGKAIGRLSNIPKLGNASASLVERLCQAVYQHTCQDCSHTKVTVSSSSC